MGLETTVNFISDLNPLNPAEGDLAKDGDNHIRLTKAAIKQTFPNITGAVTATHSDLNTRLVPSGVILMWSGSIATIPSGWFLCNGVNGTPDLRDRFLVGAGSTYAVGATGGATTVALVEANLPAHTHSVSGATEGHSNDHFHTGTTDGMNSGTVHSHDYATGGVGGTGAPSLGSNGVQFAQTSSVNLNHTHNFTTSGTNANHTHNFSAISSSVGSGTAHENRPPYFALAYIMKE